MPSQTHRLLLAARATTGPTLCIERADGTVNVLPLDDEPPRTSDDPDGPLVPMMPREYWDGTAEADAEAGRAMLARDAALIAAIAKLWG